MNRVVIHTPARLHFGLIDMNGQLGRIDGGIGVEAIEPGGFILDGGAAGIVMGRNIWQSERPVPLVKVVRAMIHEDLSLQEAVLRLREGG